MNILYILEQIKQHHKMEQTNNINNINNVFSNPDVIIYDNDYDGLACYCVGLNYKKVQLIDDNDFLKHASNLIDKKVIYCGTKFNEYEIIESKLENCLIIKNNFASRITTKKCLISSEFNVEKLKIVELTPEITYATLSNKVINTKCKSKTLYKILEQVDDIDELDELDKDLLFLFSYIEEWNENKFNLKDSYELYLAITNNFDKDNFEKIMNNDKLKIKLTIDKGKLIKTIKFKLFDKLKHHIEIVNNLMIIHVNSTFYEKDFYYYFRLKYPWMDQIITYYYDIDQNSLIFNHDNTINLLKLNKTSNFDIINLTSNMLFGSITLMNISINYVLFKYPIILDQVIFKFIKSKIVNSVLIVFQTKSSLDNNYNYKIIVNDHCETNSQNHIMLMNVLFTDGNKYLEIDNPKEFDKIFQK
jgi:hypothetical protein